MVHNDLGFGLWAACTLRLLAHRHTLVKGHTTQKIVPNKKF